MKHIMLITFLFLTVNCMVIKHGYNGKTIITHLHKTNSDEGPLATHLAASGSGCNCDTAPYLVDNLITDADAHSPQVLASDKANGQPLISCDCARDTTKADDIEADIETYMSNDRRLLSSCRLPNCFRYNSECMDCLCENSNENCEFMNNCTEFTENAINDQIFECITCKVGYILNGTHCMLQEGTNKIFDKETKDKETTLYINHYIGISIGGVFVGIILSLICLIIFVKWYINKKSQPTTPNVSEFIKNHNDAREDKYCMEEERGPDKYYNKFGQNRERGSFDGGKEWTPNKCKSDDNDIHIKQESITIENDNAIIAISKFQDGARLTEPIKVQVPSNAGEVEQDDEISISVEENI
eukprot:304680_1